MNDLHISIDGLRLIAQYEGFRANVYKDAVGKDTVGYGHLVKHGEVFDHALSVSDAIDLLRKDVAIAEAAIKAGVKVALNQNQFGALVSLVFNIGGGNFATSTLLRDLNASKYADAAKEFLRWNHADGKILSGLTMRRMREKELFEKTFVPVTSTIVP